MRQNTEEVHRHIIVKDCPERDRPLGGRLGRHLG